MDTSTPPKGDPVAAARNLAKAWQNAPQGSLEKPWQNAESIAAAALGMLANTHEDGRAIAVTNL